MSVSQRTADEREHRRGLVLGLTMAEVLLLVLFLLMLALGWRMDALQKEAAEERSRSQRLAQQLVATNEALSKAIKIDPNVPPELLSSAIGLLAQLGSDVRPTDIEFMSTLMKSSGGLEALNKLIAAAILINPDDPIEVLKRGIAMMNRVGPNTNPEQIVTPEQHAAVSNKLKQVSEELTLLRGPGNGLTMPPCWKGVNNQPEYMFDIMIREQGLVVVDATPSRADDPAWKLMDPLARNIPVTGNVFRKATERLFAHSQKANCRHYTRIRDRTGDASKKVYKDLVAAVQDHFYPYFPRERGRGGRPPASTADPNTAVGGPD